MGDFDASEVRSFALELAEMPKGTSRKIAGSLTRHTRKVAEKARAFAPVDRPWLSTPEGIRYDTRGMSRRVYSPVDDRGRPVAVFVEFGTASMAPRPLLLEALNQVSPSFQADVERIFREETR